MILRSSLLSMVLKLKLLQQIVPVCFFRWKGVSMRFIVIKFLRHLEVDTRISPAPATAEKAIHALVDNWAEEEMAEWYHNSDEPFLNEESAGASLAALEVVRGSVGMETIQEIVR